MKINPQSPIPIYEQIVNEVIKLITSGGLTSGETLPSVRRLARQAGIANNTVSKAYGELEARGYIKTYSNKGAFVLEQQSYEAGNPIYEEFNKLILSCLKSNVEPHTIRRLVDDLLIKYEHKNLEL